MKQQLGKDLEKDRTRGNNDKLKPVWDTGATQTSRVGQQYACGKQLTFFWTNSKPGGLELYYIHLGPDF